MRKWFEMRCWGMADVLQRWADSFEEYARRLRGPIDVGVLADEIKDVDPADSVFFAHPLQDGIAEKLSRERNAH